MTIDWLEGLAAAATLVNVWLLVRASIWNWPWGAIAVVAYAVVFWRSRLWSSMALQLAYYLPMQLVGWWSWSRTGPAGDDDLPVTTLSPRARLAWVAGGAVLALALGGAMARLGAAQSWGDAGVTAASVVGQALMTRKKLEHWACWIVVNVTYAAWLLPRQGLWLSAALYAVLLVLAVRGWRTWAASLGGAHPGDGAGRGPR